MRIRLFALLPLLFVPLARSQDWVNTAARAQMNAQIATLWASPVRGIVEENLATKLQEIANTYHDKGDTKIWIQEVYGLETQLVPPPGFEKLDSTGMSLRAPLAGSWGLKVSANVKVKQKVLFFWITKSFKLTAVVVNLWARAKAKLDSSNSEAPKVSEAKAPEIGFNLSVVTDHWYLNVLYFIFKPFLDAKVKQAVDDALAGLAPALQGLEGHPKSWGTGGPGVGAPEPYDYKTPAIKISQKIQQYHLPYKTLLTTVFQTPYTGTWEQSWNVDPGPVAGYGGWGDSAIWTGHALAAEAFRYKMTADPQAKELILTMVDGLGQLAQMRGTPGLLNRAIAPPGTYTPDAETYLLDWNGQPHVMWDFISRDQYMGVFFGLITAHDFVNDGMVKTKCRQTIEMLLDYLLANKWVAYKRDGSISTAWHMNFAQQLAWVRSGRKVNPTKYAGAWAQHAFLADLCWFSPWLETFDPVGSYYKFNLQHGSFYTYLRLETVPLLWQRGYKGFRILRKALQHHLQAHFNMCAIGISPAQSAGYGAETKTLLRQFLQRHRRHVAFTTTDVETATYTPPSIGTFSYEIDGMPTSTASTISKYPLPPHKRPATDFLWQRDPFRLVSGGDGTAEDPGVDYLLPYWMARYYGVIGE